ncbi:MAG: hypothetical protein KKF68_03095 [Nanoarchaeota archaeon]|nr:hypothetical protein [Nanoarchaeota archaeon]
MIKRDFFNNKSGGITFPTIIFFILNLMFFVLLMMFVFKAPSGAVVYEQMYAKQIALMIDEAKPLMEFSISFKKGLEIAEKNEIDKQNIFKIDGVDNKVIVKLSNSRGYSFKYFSDYEINYYFDEDLLILIINERIENDL